MNKNQTVVGSYRTEDEAIRKVKELLGEGYLKNEVTIFTNPEVSERLSNPENVDVAEPDLNGNDEDGRNEQTFWQSIKEAFKVRDEEFYNDPNYTSEDDLLHDYHDEVAAGSLIVVVDNYHGSKDVNQSPEGKDPAHVADPDDSVDARVTAGDLGTTAGFPDEGNVTGMGDGGEPPIEPKQNEGVPPELEDTNAEADSDDLKEERLRNADDNPNV